MSIPVCLACQGSICACTASPAVHAISQSTCNERHRDRRPCTVRDHLFIFSAYLHRDGRCVRVPERGGHAFRIWAFGRFGRFEGFVRCR